MYTSHAKDFGLRLEIDSADVVDGMSALLQKSRFDVCQEV